jgi:hypothetical protein
MFKYENNMLVNVKSGKVLQVRAPYDKENTACGVGVKNGKDN